MPTPTEIANLAVKIARKECDEKIADLQRQIDELKKIVNQLVSEKTQNIINCRRCGRSGHWATSCYARTHVDGEQLDSDDSEYNSE
jgi:predicted AlkP superfamily phosphohydrolase/phosphomutase